MASIFTRIYYLFLQRFNNKTRSHYARLIGVQVGADCRIYSAEFGTEPYLISIGNHVTISGEAMLITHDGGVWVFRQSMPDVDFIRPIIVEDNVFVGARSIILPGVIIGADSVVAAGAVVTKSIPPGSVVAGVPARVISTTEAYMKKLEMGDKTKLLSAKEKRKILIKIWGTTPTQWKKRMFELTSDG